jgi:allantoin racemase
MAERRILYQLVAPLNVTVGPQELVRRRAFLEGFATPGTEVHVRSPAMGRDSIESAWDAAVVGPHLIDGVLAAEREGFDGAIIGCFSDPVLDAAREAASIPVIGPGMAAVHYALQLGDRISIISPNNGDPGRSRAFMRGLGLEDRLASARGMGLSVPDLARAHGAAIEQIVATARRCVHEDGADVLILGCMSMAFLDPTPQLVSNLGIPVVNPVIAALKTAEFFLAHGLSQSRARWPMATSKTIYTVDCQPSLQGEI